MAFRFVGVDPGLVHTGVVELTFDTEARHIQVASEVVIGPDAGEVQRFIMRENKSVSTVFIEGYRSRSNFNTDTRMIQVVAEMKKALPKATVVENMGVVKIVKRPLMELLGVWSFSQTTHHQDLRSAARIAIFGMLKNDVLNELLSDVVRDHLNKRSWHVDVR